MDPRVKQLKEAIIAGQSGTTLFETINLACTAQVFLFLNLAVLNVFLPSGKSFLMEAFRFLIEFLLFVLPVTVHCTFWDSPFAYSICFLAFSLTIVLICSIAWTARGPSLGDRMVALLSPSSPLSLVLLRVSLMMITVISIMAVDFPAYPRRFVKTETFGISPMDVGNGGFVFMSGLAYRRGSSAGALLKSPSPGSNDRAPSRLRRWMKTPHFKAFILMFMGIVRCVATKMLGYQEHVSEYGVHWNFFVTLGCVTLIACLFLKSASNAVAVAAVGLPFLIYQYCLTQKGLTGLVFDAPRTANFFWANREGILDLFAYTMLHVLGSALGAWVRRPRPTVRGQVRLAVKLLAGALAIGVTLWMSEHPPNCPACGPVSRVWKIVADMFLGQASRRLGNVSYVLAVTASMMASLGCCVFIELALSLVAVVKGHSSVREMIFANAPITRSIANRGLSLFLLANLCVGLTNLLVQTYAILDWPHTLGVLAVYDFLCVLPTFFLK